MYNKTNFGLFSGLTGETIYLFFRYKKYKNKTEFNEAKKILNSIAHNISNINDFSYKDGLLGIGWGIQYIIKAKFIKADADDILEDLDSEIYKLIMYTKSSNPSLESGALGRIQYCYSRLCSSHAPSDFKYLPIKEILMLSIDELHDYINKENSKYRLVGEDTQVTDIEDIKLTRQALNLCLKLNKLIANRYVFELIPRLNNQISIFLNSIDLNNSKSNEINYLLDVYEKSLLNLGDTAKIHTVNKYRSTLGRKSEKKDTLSLWFNNLNNLCIDKNDDWKDGWLV